MTQAKTAALTKPKKNRGYKGPRPQQAQSQMETQLSNLFNLSSQRTRGHLPDIKNIGDEGVHHINVHRHSKSKLGFLLSTAASHDFMLFNKRFTSIDNLMLYYRSHCTVDALATGTVGLTRDFNRNRAKDYPQLKNLFVVACLGYMEIFKRTPALMQAMDANKLPLDSYDTQSDTKLRRRHAATATLVSAVQEAFQAVRDNREPDLKKFMFNETARNLAVRAGTEGHTFEEVVRSVFSPRTVREKFLAEHAELAAKFKADEQKRQQERKASRDAQTPKKVFKEQKPMELGDASDMLDGAALVEKNVADRAAAKKITEDEKTLEAMKQVSADIQEHSEAYVEQSQQIVANTAKPEAGSLEELVQQTKELVEAQAEVAYKEAEKALDNFRPTAQGDAQPIAEAQATAAAPITE